MYRDGKWLDSCKFRPDFHVSIQNSADILARVQEVLKFWSLAKYSRYESRHPQLKYGDFLIFISIFNTHFIHLRLDFRNNSAKNTSHKYLYSTAI